MKTKILALLLLLIPALAGAATLSDIRTAVRRNIRDTDSSNPRYSDALLNDMINEAQRQVNNMTWVALKTTSYILSPQTSYYTLPEDFLASHQVYFKPQNAGAVQVMTQMTLQSLYQTQPDWEQVGSGSPPNWYCVTEATNSVATATATKRISYIPVPNSQSTGTVTMWYLQRLPELTADSDIVFGGRAYLQPYTEALAFYVTYRMLALDGIYTEANFYFQLFGQTVRDMDNRANAIPDYHPSIGVGTGGSGLFNRK